jgi:hypothetical protein
VGLDKPISAVWESRLQFGLAKMLLQIKQKANLSAMASASGRSADTFKLCAESLFVDTLAEVGLNDEDL